MFFCFCLFMAIMAWQLVSTSVTPARREADRRFGPPMASVQAAACSGPHLTALTPCLQLMLVMSHPVWGPFLGVMAFYAQFTIKFK